MQSTTLVNYFEDKEICPSSNVDREVTEQNNESENGPIQLRK